MMASGKIQILPLELQNQIAAGEVVERPASVLKELIENALDAGATRIMAAIKGGGQTQILVEDNGYGMGPEDLPQAMTRHATSKIKTFQDLLHIVSFGFRGEALPSIGSVSRMQIRSIHKGQTEGAELNVDFGLLSEVKPVPFREGTSIQVRDLFANTPARLKFLKTQQTEAKRCQETVCRFALANPETAFTFVSNDRIVSTFQDGQTCFQRLQVLWPQAITDRLLTVQAADEDYTLTGYIGHPETAQGRGDRILFFVNQRPVQDKMLTSALRQAFKGRLLHKEYPQATLFLEIPNREVDINVHPAKLEVRFRDEKRVFSLLHRGITAALAQESSRMDNVQPGAGSEDHEPQPNYKFQTFEEFIAPQSDEELAHVREGFDSQRTGDFAQQKSLGPMLTAAPAPSPVRPGIGGLTYMGQIQKSYLLLTSSQGQLLILDQHAAHERILYHRLATHGEQGVKRPLAIPMHRALHPSEESHLTSIAPLLRRMGFDLDCSQSGTVLIRAVPVHLDPSRARELLDQILAQQTESQEDLWQLMACRQAIKAGEALSTQEALELIQLWLDTPEKEFCPHGRPAVITMGAKELERMFKRRG
jgi:DNA mismatch repair protein MutL